MRNIMSWIKTVSMQLIIGIFFLELFSFLGSKAGIFIVNYTPALYQFQSSSSISESYNEGRTEREVWGAWRRPNSTTRQGRECFDIEISTNEVGARDSSFEQLEGKNLVLLGDSFAEGFGVEYTNTAQYILEQKLGINVLNFGSAGNFGPLQQYLIYRDLASSYEHDSVLIFVLPANDFTDNDRAYWEGSEANRIRYRPYYSYQDNILTPWYFPEATATDIYGDYSVSTDSSNVTAINLTVRIKKFLIGNLWLSNPLRTLSYILTKHDITAGNYYLSATEEQQSDLVRAYSSVVVEAAGKPVSFVIIPTQRDFMLLENNVELVESQVWHQGLKELASSSGGVFIDLINFRTRDTTKLFHTCDGHWSEFGNIWAAGAIVDEFSNH